MSYGTVTVTRWHATVITAAMTTTQEHEIQGRQTALSAQDHNRTQNGRTQQQLRGEPAPPKRLAPRSRSVGLHTRVRVLLLILSIFPLTCNIVSTKVKCIYSALDLKIIPNTK